MSARSVLQLQGLLFISVLVFTNAEARDCADPLLGTPNGLAHAPPIGWKSGNKFACIVNKTRIRTAADAMISTGVRDAGYNNMVSDDCWQVAARFCF